MLFTRLLAEETAGHLPHIAADFFSHALSAARLRQRKDDHACDDCHNQPHNSRGGTFVLRFCGRGGDAFGLGAAGLRAIERRADDLSHHLCGIEHALFADGVRAEFEQDGIGR